jgi:cobalt-zinc-cadmium efflux system protein
MGQTSDERPASADESNGSYSLIMAKQGSDHDHVHGASASGARLIVALVISIVILLAEVLGAVLTGSLALVVDAGHLLTDAGGLAVAVVASYLARRPPTSRRTWGYRRAEVLSATAQAAVLLAVGLFVLVEGIHRLIDPAPIAARPLLVFGIIGLVGNVAALIVLSGSRKANFNFRAAFLEVGNDALGSLSVIAASIVITLTGWTRADAVAALVIGALILPRSLLLLRETIDVLLESTPRGLDLASVRAHLLEQKHVLAVHDLHVTQIATGLPVLTAHVVVDDECFYDGHASGILDELQACVAEHFSIAIEHSTFQLERAVHGDHEHDTHA